MKYHLISTFQDKQNINNRYIELFLRATPPSGGGGGGGGGGGSLEGRNMTSSFNDAPDSLFSRRGTASGNVSNSAYDGFYGTSLYRAANSAGTYIYPLYLETDCIL